MKSRSLGDQYTLEMTDEIDHSNRYYRGDEEYRSMKFGEEIGIRCLRKLKERSDELRKLESCQTRPNRCLTSRSKITAKRS